MNVTNVPAAKVKAGSNDRKDFNQNQLLDLAESIRVNGLAQPPTLRPLPDGFLEVVAGERRVRAMVDILHWTDIPAIVREMDDEQASAIMLAENTSRADLNPIEEAEAFQSRMKRFGWDAARIAEIAGLSADLVQRRLKLLTLIPEVQHLVRHDHFPVGHGEAMAVLDNNRQRIAMRIYSEATYPLPLAKFRHIINELLEQQQQESLFDLESFWIEQVKTENMPRRGKRAFTNAPTRPDLPPVRRDNKWDAAKIIETYIADLLTSGHTAEAGTLGNVYDTLVHHNYLAVPMDSVLIDLEE